MGKRTDIFGCVVYEMLTGLRPFPGDSAADVLGAITGREPDWARLPHAETRARRDQPVSDPTKDPDRRLHDIADARIEVADAVGDPRAIDDLAPPALP